MGFVRDVVSGLTGETAAEAALQGAGIQGQAIDRATALQQQLQERFDPLVEQGLSQASFLTDPQQQFDFLQSNPLFQSALQQAETGTQNLAAARGRLSAGDTLQQLSQNVLTAASPLIGQQSRNIQNLLTTGGNIATGTTGNITDLITTGGATEAAGLTGAATARGQGAQNILQSGLLAGSLFASDERLKENIKKIGEEKGHNIYSWTWNELAKSFGLTGDSFGVLAQEVNKTRPDAVITDGGYMKVKYNMLGISHGG
jgi:hypothetical protein